MFNLCSIFSWVSIFDSSPCLSILDPHSFLSRHWLSSLTLEEVLLPRWIPRIGNPSSMHVSLFPGAQHPDPGADKLHSVPWESTCCVLLGLPKADSMPVKNKSTAHCHALLHQLPPWRNGSLWQQVWAVLLLRKDNLRPLPYSSHNAILSLT